MPSYTDSASNVEQSYSLRGADAADIADRWRREACEKPVGSLWKACGKPAGQACGEQQQLKKGVLATDL